MLKDLTTHTLDLTKIVAQATPLFERMHHPALRVAGEPHPKRLASSLQRWQTALGADSQDALRKRLTWDGYSLAEVERFMGEVQLSPAAELPAWTAHIARGVERSAELAGLSRSAYAAEVKTSVRADDPQPYEEIWVPFVQTAVEALRERAGDELHQLRPAALKSLQHSLLTRLAVTGAHCLELEFSIVRLRRRGRKSGLFQSAEPTGRTLYAEFVNEMQREKTGQFFEEYAVLARLIGTVIELWVATTTEFLTRLRADMAEIEQRFGGLNGRAPGRVAALTTDLSDPHNQGRTVFILTFDSGLKLVYKPKNLGVEEAFYHFLEWLNAQERFPAFRIFKFIKRPEYGWCEYVDHSPCESADMVQRYYQRAGVLLAWLYALEATDCHYENLIACGEDPVLIDLETIIHQRSFFEIQTDQDNTESQAEAHAAMWHSVFRTGFLPQWQFSKDGASYDASGLASSDDQISIVQVPTWEDINTDQMRLATDLYEARARVNLPHMDGQAMTLDGYIDEFVSGFEETYRFILAQRELLLGDESPLRELFAQSMRYIFRNTANYVSVLDSALNPKYMRDGVERSIVLEGLNQRFVAENESRPFFWSAIAFERQDLEVLDVPFFKTPVASRDMTSAADRLVVRDHFEQSAASLVRQRLEQMSVADLEKQTQFIKASLYSRVSRPSLQAAQNRMESRPAEELQREERVTAVELEAFAQHIAEELRGRAIEASDGSLSWIALGFIEYAQKYRLQPMDYDLYNGSSGIGVFLAAMAKTTGDERYANWARGTLQLLRQHLRNSEVSQKMSRRIGLGAATGIGSLIYALVKAGQFLGDDTFFEDAGRAAQLITPELIAKDDHLDVARGAAGGILGLMALFEVTGEQRLLQQAAACADHLAQARLSSQSGQRVWPNHSQQLLSGLLHGASGTAYAFLRLQQHMPRPDLRDMAEEALAFERSLFVAERQNWLPYEGAGRHEMMTTWCHGAPGIGLARLGMRGMLDSAALASDIQHALITTEQLGMTGIDHLCCGNFGRLELFLKAAQVIDAPELADKAHRWAAFAVRRMQQSGQYFFSPDIPAEIFQPALFTGTAGIGYSLLRLASGLELPSLLLWE